jgi:hypothetical protein
MSGADTTYSATIVKGNIAHVSSVVAQNAPSCLAHTYSYAPEGPNREIQVSTRFNIRLTDANGWCKWDDSIHNLVVTDGLNKMLDATFKTGYASPAWYVGLISGTTTPVISAADLLDNHGGWNEAIYTTNYSESARPALTLGSVTNGAVDNSLNTAIFHIIVNTAINGCFITTAATGTTGILWDAATFIDGARSVVNGDILHVTATISVTAS